MKAGGESVRRKTLTLVVPVYREHRRLLGSLRAISEFIRQTADLEVDAVLVDDGSPDDTAEVIEAYVREQGARQIRLVRYPVNRGKGYAVKTGVREARGDLILMSDADLSTPLSDWLVLRAAVEAGADIACGSRAVPGAHIGKPPPWHRRILSRVFNLLVRASGVHGFRDTQCGFKLFTAEAARAVFGGLRIERFAFDVELLARARDLGFRVAEVPVNWDYSGHSTVRLFSSGGRMLWDLMLLALRRAVFGRAKA